jgi:hypothetical protein
MEQERRGLRFPIDAPAEIAPQEEPDRKAPARVTELSFRGCFVVTDLPFAAKSRVLFKIFYRTGYCEGEATVLYVKPPGMGLLFGDIKPHFREVLQGWIFSLLHK